MTPVRRRRHGAPLPGSGDSYLTDRKLLNRRFKGRCWAESRTTPDAGDTLPAVARFDRWREFIDRLHPSGLLYATYEHRLIAELDHDRLPRHVAVLADGNRRWARTNAPGQP